MRRLSELPSGMVDARERVTGRIAFASGLRIQGALEGKLLRSPVPHARIRSIDTSLAVRVPGVRAVLTGADLAAKAGVDPWYGVVYRDQPVLAIEKVRFAGEPVAAVAAADADAAIAGVERIRVEYEELPGVFDATAALAHGAPLVHEFRPAAAGSRGAAATLAATSNVCHEFRLRKGDVELGFSGAWPTTWSRASPTCRPSWASRCSSIEQRTRSTASERAPFPP